MNAAVKTIFIVDDDELNLKLGKKALSGTYQVFTFDSGLKLFKALEKVIPDMILLDVLMPEMGGYEVIERIKKDEATANIPVIFLTSLDSEDHELKGLSLGGVDYITKPFSVPLLIKRIEMHLLVESQKRELIDYNNNLEFLVEKKTREVNELKDAILSTVAELVEEKDVTTGNHIYRTQRYIKILLDAMRRDGIYENEISKLDGKLVLQSSQLHDVGKIYINDSILLKPGKLTEEEFEIMKEHTTFGAETIDRISKRASNIDFLEYARIFTAYHHEKWDGSGYPSGLKGEDIPFLGRLMAIVDVYDALVSKRPYKEAIPHSDAVAIIEGERGTHFDPVLVDVFLDMQSEFEEAVKELKGSFAD